MRKVTRSVAVLASVALVFGAFVAGPADAKKKKKKKPVPACAPYATPDWATDSTTTVVTDAATAETPVSVEIATDPGLGFSSPDGPDGDQGETSHKFHNIQVDSANPSANLFVRAEYTEVWDYDLYLRLSDLTAVAYEADFNPATVNGPSGLGTLEGASAEPGASQIDGYPSPDCSGYTADIVSGSSGGGAVTLKIWLTQ